MNCSSTEKALFSGSLCAIERAERPPPGDRAGHVAPNGYRYVGVDGKKLLEHRVIFFLHHGREACGGIDHINGIPVDNRPENLRECTQAQNLQNVGALRPDNTSGVRGVYWDRGKRKFAAEIIADSEKRFLGRFDTLEQAAACRRQAEIDLMPFRRN